MKGFLKYSSLLVAAAVMIACEGQKDEGDGTIGEQNLVLTSDKNLIQTGKDAATLTLTLNGEPVTEGVTFFDKKTNNILDIVDFKFTADKPGEYELWASYGTAISNAVTIMAVATDIPQTPADPAPESTSFKSRVLLTQFTGVNCGYCPQMMQRLHPILEDETKADEIVWVACHSYDSDDIAYVPRSAYSDAVGAVFPSLNLDFTFKFALTAANTTEVLESLINEGNTSKKEVAAGLAVNARLVEGQVIAKVTVKSANTAEYRVGAFLLEDGLSQKQISATEPWMSTHDACIRHIDAGTGTGMAKLLGHKLGKIEKGKSADYLFIWNLDDIWDKANSIEEYWDPFVESNLRMAVYVTTTKTIDGEEAYYVNNAVAVEFNKEIPFEYAE